MTKEEIEQLISLLKKAIEDKLLLVTYPVNEDPKSIPVQDVAGVVQMNGPFIEVIVGELSWRIK